MGGGGAAGVMAEAEPKAGAGAAWMREGAALACLVAYCVAYLVVCLVACCVVRPGAALVRSVANGMRTGIYQYMV